MRRRELKDLILIVVTATVTVVVCQWIERPAPFCCPGGRHVQMEGGKWRHELVNPVYDSKRGMDVEGK